MKNHVLRPLFVVLGIVALILAARAFSVPKDFGVHERGYMYGWYRKGNEEDWKKFKVKYQGKEYCRDCHPDRYDSINKTPHKNIQCENCHGPGGSAHTGAKSYEPGVCNQCHNGGGSHVKGEMLKNAKHAEEASTAWNYPTGPSRQACVRCHSGYGYVSFLENPTEQASWNNEKHTVTCAVCHDSHKTCGVGAEIAARCMEEGFDYLDAPVKRVAGLDVPIPCAPAAIEAVYPGVDSIVVAVERLLGLAPAA